jgi:DNA mismatch repair protein MLH3
MPVRVKQRAMSAEKSGGNSKEWEELRRYLALLLLAWPKTVAVTIREAGTNEKLLIRGYSGDSASVSYNQIDVSTVCSILSQASLVSIEDKPFWVSARASTPKIAITSALSLLPSATKHTQFISFGIQPLFSHDTCSVLHDEINRMFLNSSFGNDEEAVELDASEIDRRAKDKRYKGDGFTNKELRGGKKSIYRWPMFYINIQQNLRLADGRGLDVDGILDDKGSSLGAIMELLQAMIWEFLTKHHFRPKASRSRRSKTSTTAEDANASALDDPGFPAISATNIHARSASISTERKNSVFSPLSPISMTTNMNAPSSQREPSRLDTPFDVWTRVKIGSRPTKFALSELLQQTSDTAKIPRPCSAPPSSTSRISTPIPDTNFGSATPLLSNKGKIIRQPFEDVAFSAGKFRTSIPKGPQQTLQAHDHSRLPGEDVIAWTNPVTRVKSLVNQRTGLTVRADKAKSSYTNTASSSTTHKETNFQRPANTNVSGTEGPSPWLNNILKTWNNPIFCPAEPSIPRVSFDGSEASTQEILHGRGRHCSQLDIDRAFKQSSAGIDGRISKAALNRAEVICQVDTKFILVKLESAKTVGAADSGGGTLLVLIDQHAADERIRIETLLEEFFAPPVTGTSMPTESGVRTSLLGKPIDFEISSKEARLLYKYKEYFARWGIIFEFLNEIHPETTSKGTALQRLIVLSLPPSIIERCKLDPRLLIDLIRTEAWKIHDRGAQPLPAAEGDWLQRIHNCPRGIIDMLNSRACRSAIMFNDELSKEQCEALVGRLAKCKFPFQCAHGRPSLVPLVDLGRMDMRASKQLCNGHGPSGSFGANFNKWQGNMK